MTNTISIKQLATKAGMEARGLRRLLRDKFPRMAKGKAYEWEVNDPQVELILQAATERKSKIKKVNYDASEPKTEKPTTKKNNTPAKPVKKQLKTQKPKTTKKVVKTDSAKKGGEANDDEAASA
jgi:hypothetical protein